MLVFLFHNSKFLLIINIHRSKSSRRSRSPSTSSTTSSRSTSRSSSPETTKKDEKKKETLTSLFEETNRNWHLAQKSEVLMFDQIKEPEDKASETFIWRKKNQKIGLDKLEPQQLLMVNKIKKEETSVSIMLDKFIVFYLD